jgi:hypothetical protein
MSKRRISDQDGLEAIRSNNTPTAVRYLLQQIESSHPGGTIELRVPPYGAAQIIDGLNHRRGTPPNVVEVTPENFLDLALGLSTFEEKVDSGAVSLSGDRASDASEVFPVKLPN